MGIQQYDVITGKPTFNDSSTTQADLQASVDYAEKVGPNSVPTFGDLASVPNKRSGMLREVLSEKRLYEYKNSTDGWVAIDKVTIYHLGPALVGTVWDGVSPIIEKHFTVAGPTDAAGFLATSWPGGAFLNGIASIQMTAGDVSNNPRSFVQRNNTTLSALGFYVYGAGGGALANASVRVNVSAVGW